MINKILPKKVEYLDNSTTYWNQYSALYRLLNIIIQLSTSWWIWYFLINIIFNEHNYVDNFFATENNPLIISGYISEMNLTLMRILFWINIFVTVCHIIKALFEIKLPADNNFIAENKICTYYIVNSFEEKDTLSQKYETLFLREKYTKNPKFLLAKAQITKLTLNKNGFKTQERVNHLSYKIIDSSESISDIIYHFDVLREKKKIKYHSENRLAQ